jgi:hypothetical protein
MLSDHLPNRQNARYLVGLFAVLTSCSLFAAERPLPVAIYSRVSSDYDRAIQSDGTPAREFYALAYGGRIDGTRWDETQSKADFPEIAGIIAQELAKQNYHFAPDKASADLMVVLHWGRTNPDNSVNFSDGINVVSDALGNALGETGSDGAFSLVNEAAVAAGDAQARLDSALSLLQMENRDRQRREEDIAKILGYTDELKRNNDIARFAGSDRFDMLLNEVRDPRYYVVVTAYDFKQLTADSGAQKPKPRWVTRFSIRTRGNDFMEKIDQMALKAGSYFGRDSGRLIRDRRGEVTIGDLQVVGTSPDDSDSD